MIKLGIYKVYTKLGGIMSKHKTHGKDKKKSSQLVIRIEKAERDAFVALCDQLDTSAAREIRRFMRELVAAHSGDVVAEAIEGKSASVEAAPAATTVETEAVSDDTKPDDVEMPKKKLKRAAR